MVGHGRLEQVHQLQPGHLFRRGHQDDEGGAAANDDGVDKHPQRLQKAGLGGVGGIPRRSGAGGGAGAGLVGKQPPLHPVHDHRAKAPRRGLAQTERLLKDAAEHIGQDGDIHTDEDEGDDKVAGRHDGHQHIQHPHGGVLPQYDGGGQGCQHNSGVNGLDVKGVLEGGGHGVGDDLADAAPADQAGDGKQRRQNRVPPQFPAPPLLDKAVDIIGRPSPPAAVQRVFFLMELGQGGLNESGGRADQRRNPHPEHRPRPPGGNGCHHPDQVAHAHPGGGGNNEGLDAGDGAPLPVGPLFRRRPKHLREQPDGQHPGADGKKDARGDEQRNQQRYTQRPAPRQGDYKEVAPQQVVGGGDGIGNWFHGSLLGNSVRSALHPGRRDKTSSRRS